MIKASELRIGNMVRGFGEYDGLPLPICSLHSDNTFRLLVGEKSIGCFSTREIKPITLTPEWLERLGYKDLGGYFSNTKDGLWPQKDGGFLYGDIEKEVKYVHQLQNLHFALTGEELTIS